MKLMNVNMSMELLSVMVTVAVVRRGLKTEGSSDVIALK